MSAKERSWMAWGVIAAMTAATTAIVVAVILAFTVSREGSHRRDAIRHATGNVIVARCQSENELRHQLRELVKAGRDNLDGYHRRGLLTDAEYRETLSDQDEALNKLRRVLCSNVRIVFLRTSN